MKKIIALGIVFAPAVAFAQNLTVQEQSLTGVVGFVKTFMTTATGLIMAAATLYFLWGVFQFVKSGGDEEGKSEGRKKIIAGIIGLAVMGSVWGLVRWVTGTTGTAGGTALPPPSLGL